MRKFIALAVVALALVAFVAVPANAASTRVVCEANGIVDIGGTTGAYTWDLAGSGICLDTLQGNFTVTFTGGGTSASLGLCDGVVVQGLELSVHYTFLNIRTQEITQPTDRWFAPLTTFPLATPYLIQRGGSFNGAGAIITRILLSCPPAGSHVATFAFTTTT